MKQGDTVFKFILKDAQEIAVRRYNIESRYVDTLILDNGERIEYNTLNKTYIDFKKNQLYMYSTKRSAFKDFEETLGQYFKIMLKYYMHKQEVIIERAKKLGLNVPGDNNLLTVQKNQN